MPTGTTTSARPVQAPNKNNFVAVDNRGNATVHEDIGGRNHQMLPASFLIITLKPDAQGVTTQYIVGTTKTPSAEGVAKATAGFVWKEGNTVKYTGSLNVVKADSKGWVQRLCGGARTTTQLLASADNPGIIGNVASVEYASGHKHDYPLSDAKDRPVALAVATNGAAKPPASAEGTGLAPDGKATAPTTSRGEEKGGAGAANNGAFFVVSPLITALGGSGAPRPRASSNGGAAPVAAASSALTQSSITH